MSPLTEKKEAFDKIIDAVMEHSDGETFNGHINYDNPKLPHGKVAFDLNGVEYYMDIYPSSMVSQAAQTS